MAARPPFALTVSVLVLAGSSIFPGSRLSAQATDPESRHLVSPTEAEQIDAVFAAFDGTRTPGCALGVVREGALSFSRGYGMASLDHGIAIGPGTVFRTGSVSKQFTAAVVVMLAGEGVFSLDDDIRTHFPEIPEYDAPITVRHLLHHTSGIRDYLELMGMRGVGDEATYTEEDVVALLARQKGLNFTPGSHHLYSNSGYLLLSRLVERTTGRTLREQAEKLFFGPLGMEATHFHDDHREIVPGRATGYDRAPSGGFLVSQTTLDIVGDGGVYTSVEEMARWMANYWTLEAGGEDWLSTLEQRGVLANGDILDYAMGLNHGIQRGLPYIGHGGAFVGYRAGTLRYPDEDLAITVLCNFARTDPMTMAMDVGEILLEDRMGPAATVTRGEVPPRPTERQAPVGLDPAQTMAYAAVYYSEEVDATFKVTRGEAGLLVDVNGAMDLPLRPLAEDRFRAGFLTLTFQRENGRVVALRAGSGRAGGVLFERR